MNRNLAEATNQVRMETYVRQLGSQLTNFRPIATFSRDVFRSFVNQRVSLTILFNIPGLRLCTIVAE